MYYTLDHLLISSSSEPGMKEIHYFSATTQKYNKHSPVILAKKAGKSGQIDNKGFMTDYSRSGSQLTYLKSPKKSISPISKKRPRNILEVKK